MALEEKLRAIGRKAGEVSWKTLERGVNLYNKAYEKHPTLTSYISTAIGTVGGDAIAKRFVKGENVKLRDIAFTAVASLIQAHYYPKLIPLAEKRVNSPKIQKVFDDCKINSQWAKAITLTALFFPINMLYWNFLSIKHKTAVSSATDLLGVRTIAQASVPYLGVDYLVANKLDKKYALPVWSASELGWNTYICLKNYLVGKIFKSAL